MEWVFIFKYCNDSFGLKQQITLLYQPLTWIRFTEAGKYRYRPGWRTPRFSEYGSPGNGYSAWTELGRRSGSPI